MIALFWLALARVAIAEVRLPEPPLGLDLYMASPESNPITRDKVRLGRKLFFNKRLSADGTLACATCHDPRQAFSDGRAVARGIGGAAGTRNSPAIVNRGYGSAFFWDGRAATLERQVIEPISNPKELGLATREIEGRTGLKAAQVAEALASYVRTIRSGDSRVDRYVNGQRPALTETERKGLALFRGKGNCVSCHVGPNFTDEQFHNTGVAWRDRHFLDDGRFAVTGVERDRGAFKTPTLREVARTAPYMHDGSLATLEQVIDFYSEGGRTNPNLDPEIRRIGFTIEEKQALIAFLRALNGRVQEGWR
jgi:cytochrome c peroxidase